MDLKIYLPTGIFIERKVAKVKGESPVGGFCLLPRHIDYVTALVSGIFSYTDLAGKEFFLALDNGILVKKGQEVMVAARRAVAGELGMLNREVEKMLEVRKEKEKLNRTTVAKLEAGFLRRFMEFSH
ncbi:MAG: F0F1 ATP synthase subunit epsilon [Proteobacteria bacterium]|nr:F0F1 ATP synthase subunit epsilon [Pseudomonadota bacterium]MBU1456829.1 F0F1 ATP synthase subunit epsilon [Pseudomonadota bacterium]